MGRAVAVRAEAAMPGRGGERIFLFMHRLPFYLLCVTADLRTPAGARYGGGGGRPDEFSK